MSLFLRTLVAIVVVAVWAPQVRAADVGSPVRTVEVSFVGNDPYGEDPPSGSDSDSNTSLGQWDTDVSVSGGGAFADSAQNSNINDQSLTFEAYGFAKTSLYVQGTAEAEASSVFQFDFLMEDPGSLVLDGSVIGVTDFFGTTSSHDRPGQARIEVRVIDLGTSQVVYSAVVEMDGEINNPYGILEFTFEDDDAEIELPVGNYRLVIEATSSDSANQEQVEFSLANAFYEVEGYIQED